PVGAPVLEKGRNFHVTSPTSRRAALHASSLSVRTASPSSHGSDFEAFFLCRWELHMCTRANRSSVPDSFHALAAALVALASAIVALAVAAATIPWRTLRSRQPTRTRVDSTTHVEIQIHLSDGE